MKTFVSSFLLLSILAASSGSRVGAAERPPTLSKGKVLILKNEFTIEGDIERVGDRYRIRSKVGETLLPAERALVLVASLADAYAFLRGRINLDDPDERLRLAKWCRNNGLQQQALAELRIAAELRPAHAETRRLLLYWQQTPVKTTASVAQRAGSVSAGPPPFANASNSFPKPADAPPIEVTTESLGLFTTRVQPILMNTCARCHATGHGGNFRLTQVFADSISNRRTLERNLAAVLAEINVNQPEASRLLIKAVSDHAHTGQAPLRDRQSAPYRTLENWVKLTVADNPQLLDKSENRNPKSEMTMYPTKEPRAKAGEESQWGAEARAHAVPPLSSNSRGTKGKTAPPPSSSGNGSAADDPYDPEPFNRQMHPAANKPEAGQ